MCLLCVCRGREAQCGPLSCEGGIAPSSLTKPTALDVDEFCVSGRTWGVHVHVLRYPNLFSRGMEADRNVKVVGGDVVVL